MVYTNWALVAERKTAEGLDRPLVTREPKGTLKVNFGKETLGILMETKNLKKDFPDRDVPKKARDLFTRFDDLRNYNNSLEQMVTLYNYLKTDTVETEYALISSEMAALDRELRAAEGSLTWNSANIWDYIEGMRKAALDLNTRVKQAQVNLVKVEDAINCWAEVPLFTRVEEEGKPSLLNLEAREENKKKRYLEILEAVTVIQSIVAQNEKLFRIAEGGAELQVNWHKYLKYLDYMVSDGLLITIACSIGYLLDQTNPKADIEPLFTVRLELNDPDVIFRPSLDKSIMHNFFDMMVGIVDDIFHMAVLVPRIARQEVKEPENDNFLQVVNGHEELAGLKKMLMDRVELVIEQANADRVTYMEYSYLWTESRQEYMFYFLLFSRQLSEDEMALYEEDERSVKKQLPALDQFKEQIDHYEAIHAEADKIERIKVFEMWFKADIRPLKQSLLNTIKRWSWAFQKHELDHIIDSLNELNKFIDDADAGLQIEVVEGDYDNLIR